MNYLTTLREHFRFFWRLRHSAKISDAKFEGCCVLTVSGRGQPRNEVEFLCVPNAQREPRTRYGLVHARLSVCPAFS
jgi:hypothetical protein